MMMQLLVHELSPLPSPADICERLEGLPYRIFFDSGNAPGKYARYSFVAADPVSVISAKAHSSPATALVNVRAALSALAADAPDFLPPFRGGAAGYISYEFGSSLEGIEIPGAD